MDLLWIKNKNDIYLCQVISPKMNMNFLPLTNRDVPLCRLYL